VIDTGMTASVLPSVPLPPPFLLHVSQDRSCDRGGLWPWGVFASLSDSLAPVVKVVSRSAQITTTCSMSRDVEDIDHAKGVVVC
jgi:hypothetical protein